MIFILLAGFFVAFLSPLIFRLLGSKTGAVLSLLPLGMLVYFSTLWPLAVRNEPYLIQYRWIPALSVDLSFYVDGLSLFFLILIAGFGALIILYAGSYLKGHPQLGRFFMYLLLFMTAMLGLVVAGNLISLFVFWELTSLSSYLLISFDHDNETSRKSALQAMMVTVGGGLAMLTGFILLGASMGTFHIPSLLAMHDQVVGQGGYTGIVLLVLLGAFTKSAQFPFHFWLPNAMAAPTPVSAYLHSATMVKAGVYLVARFNPLLGGTALWQTLLIVTGSITMLLGALMAMRYTDLKKILAYTTISALGMLFLMLGIGTPYAVQAALIFVLAHALYKGTLFLMTGNLDHQTGSRDLAELSGLRKVLPFTALAAGLACLSMSGVVPFIGFIGKELIYEAAFNAELYNWMLLGAVVFSSVLFTAIAIQIGYGAYFGPLRSPEGGVKEAPWPMLAGPWLLSAGGLVLGLFPQLFIQPLLNVTAGQVLKDVEVLTLSLWHGFTLILGLSLATLLLGYAVYRFRMGFRRLANGLFRLEKFGPANLYEKGMEYLLRLARVLTLVTQNGYLRYYLTAILWTFIGLSLYILFSRNLSLELHNRLFDLLDFRLYELIIGLFIAMGIYVVFVTKSRLTALAAMGVVGYGLALVFILFSAPDAAMTQFLVETLTVVLFVLVLHKLPHFESFMGKVRRFNYLMLSLTFGGLMTYVLLMVTEGPLDSELKTYFGEKSVPLGQDRNIVNVILVDFRAFDTLGETVVLGIAAIGIFSLLKLKLDKEETL